MPQIFHRSANFLSRASIIGAVVLLGLLSLALWEITMSPWYTDQDLSRQQPVPFSHRHHAGELGIDCRYCHTSVEKSSFAGLPPTQTCMTCHSQIWTNSEMLEPVRASYRTDQSLAWTRVNALPDFVYFDHSIHVAKGVGCTTCHGPIAEMPLTFRAGTLVHVVVPGLPPAAGKVRAAEVGSFQSVLSAAVGRKAAGIGAAAREGIQDPEPAALLDVSPVKARR